MLNKPEEWQIRMLLEKDSTKVMVFPGGEKKKGKKGISPAFRDINPQFSKPGSALTSFCINHTKRLYARVVMSRSWGTQ